MVNGGSLETSRSGTPDRLFGDSSAFLSPSACTQSSSSGHAPSLARVPVEWQLPPCCSHHHVSAFPSDASLVPLSPPFPVLCRGPGQWVGGWDWEALGVPDKKPVWGPKPGRTADPREPEERRPVAAEVTGPGCSVSCRSLGRGAAREHPLDTGGRVPPAGAAAVVN